MNYFIQLDEEVQGPLTFDELKRRFSNGKLKECDLVRREDQRDWKPLSALQELHDSIQVGPALGNPWAVASYVLALIALLLIILFFVLEAPWFFIPSLLAIICGHVAVYKVRRTAQEVKGYLLAKVGLWMGYLVTFVIPTFVIWVMHSTGRINKRGTMTVGIIHCRQVITYLKIYSADHDGAYPDNLPGIQTSNDAFRHLFSPEIGATEKLFGCPTKPFNPDGNIGSAPQYAQALEPGENHWAMTAGLNDSMSGSIPLVFDNPIEASWPPKWNPSNQGKNKPGDAWGGGRVIIGMNDSSVAPHNLKSLENDKSELRLTREGNAIFPMDDPNLKVLNVAK